MQIPIINGIYTDENSEFRTSYPVNMMPVPKKNGVSNGFLRPMDGIASFGVGPGVDRGGINWRGTCYRVMDTKFGYVDNSGAFYAIDDVGTGGQCIFDYGFDYLGVMSGGRLYFYDGASLRQNTDTDLGTVLDFTWVDGYFMTTDGEFLVVTELGDPFSVNPLKYGSSEADPDNITAIARIRTEVYAVNRYSIELFDNVGGDLFPFERIEGSQIRRGAISATCATVFIDSVAFLGGGRNEAPAIYLGVNAASQKISTREIDLIIQKYSESQLKEALLEVRVDKSHNHLFVHLPNETLVYDLSASQAVGQPIWFVLTSGVDGFSQYRGKNLVYAYDKWIVGDPTSNKVGYLDDSIATHYGDKSRWEFGTPIVYNESNGAIFHELELVALTGRTETGTHPTISTEYSTDGETWSQPRYINAGKIGERNKRLVWLQQGYMRSWRIQRFKGDSDSLLTFSRLEARLEPLNF